MGRAPLTVLGYLTLIHGTLFEEALALLRARRPMVCPNIEAYRACRDDLIDRHGDAIARRLGDSEQSEPHANSAQRRRQAELEILRQALRHADRIAVRP